MRSPVGRSRSGSPDVDAEIAEAAAVYRKVGDVHGLAGLYNDAGYLAVTQGSYELGGDIP